MPLGAAVAVVDLLVRGADRAAARAVADRRNAQRNAETAFALLALVAALVLQGFDGQVPANVGHDAFARHLRAFERGVLAALQGQGFTSDDFGVVVGGGVPVGLALHLAGADLDADARLLADTHGHAQAGAAAFAAVSDCFRIDGRQQVDIALCIQRDVAVGL